MVKKYIGIGIVIVFLMIGFSGCNSSQDEKSTLVNGGKWNAMYTNDSGFDIYKEYTFLNDEKYASDERWYENFQDKDYGYHLRYKSSGTYQISDNKIYFNENERQFWTDYSNDWQDTDCTSYDYNFEIINSNIIKIDNIEFQSNDNAE